MRTAELAVVAASGAPLVAPVWIDLDGDDILFSTGANGELLVRVTPTKVIAARDIAD